MKKKLCLALLAIGLAATAGCTQIGYFAQAAHGQFSLLSQARPIDDWLADPQASDKLKTKLAHVRDIRRFAAAQLALPDNASYTTYADLHRPFALWNIVATPALSMTPKEWCFPVAGCVAYRGYYSKEDAQAYAEKLRSEGYDVQVGGVPAYSTLGWFNDPVLSTFIHYPEGELARLIFHELAHQVAYAPGDSQFNESFATAVEEAGIERWFAVEGNAALRKTYEEFEGRKRQFVAMLLAYRKRLETLYDSNLPDADKLQRKAAIFAALQAEYQQLKQSWGGYRGYDRFFAEPLSNAHLAAVATYHAYVPAFRALLAEKKSFPDFYRAVKSLADRSEAERAQQLAHYQPVGADEPVATVNAGAAPQAAASH